ncbi:putative porin [Microbulbifer sp. CAU 1566]|uniref:putative porin n=1 Tax=Microbulbifer sp. CAU 1566 TaxID=2933269 RepID=UPI0020035D6D|nr:putative porin [Microbulbifer sp. CAU 1566]MCK7597986.1 putative porin [Microbulbifer sp. CAU 1566]
MKFKFAALPLMLVSAIASAEQYNSFTDADYISADYGNFDTDTLSVQSQYYFGALETLGPRKEFNYILPVSNIYGGFRYMDYDGGDSDSLNIGGEYFTGQWKVFGELQDLNSTNVYSAGAGFLFTPNLLAEVEARKVEDSDTVLFVRGQYNHQLSGTDYIGFTAEVDDEFDYRHVSSKYFTALSGGQYFTAELGLTDVAGDDLFWGGEVEFYFNENTSIGAGYSEAEDYQFNATHFFNRSVAAKVSYGSNRDFDDLDIFSLGVTVQL